MIVSEGTDWVNFFFSTDADGYRIDRDEQEKIRNYERQGMWSVGYTAGIWLINNSIIENIQGLYSKDIRKWNVEDYDIAFSYNVREKGYYLYLTNKSYFGGVI
jgi:hypothetical protein